MIPYASSTLTEQEERVFEMLLTCPDTYKHMAFELGTTPECIKECAQRVFRKLRVDNRYDLLITFLGREVMGARSNATAGIQ